jgi:plasmid stabilization system protein ParE
MRKIVFDVEIKINLREAYEWYERKKEGLGDSFLEALQKSLDAIAQNPNNYSYTDESKRRIIIRKFPYKIIYQVFENEIYVSAIFHFKQNN